MSKTKKSDKFSKILSVIIIVIIAVNALIYGFEQYNESLKGPENLSQSSQTETSTNASSKTDKSKADKGKTDKSKTDESGAGQGDGATLTGSFDISKVPAFSGQAYIVINDNQPFFEESEITAQSFETYSPLDDLGRCQVAVASVGIDLMPSDDRGDIGSVKPTGWHTVKYDNVSAKYLYNRCHLIGYQLTAENANKKNLITGTRFLNVDGMLPFENMVADYIKETKNHVMYRVTPIFEGDNLLASGVLMEAYSVEDKGEGICFNIYCYNSQPGIEIDYATGDSKYVGE